MAKRCSFVVKFLSPSIAFLKTNFSLEFNNFSFKATILYCVFEPMRMTEKKAVETNFSIVVKYLKSELIKCELDSSNKILEGLIDCNDEMKGSPNEYIIYQ